MKNTDTFSGFHPLVNFLYFALVLAFSMCLMHPACLAISLAGGLAYNIYLNGHRAVKAALCLTPPAMAACGGGGGRQCLKICLR